MSQTKAQLIDNLVQPITGALGSASAPTFSFTSDPNTGIYSPGADQVAISTNGSGRLFVDANGNVGVGAVPTNYSGYNTLMHTGSTGATLEQRVSGVLAGSLTTDSQVTLKATTAIPIVFSTNNTERLRITSAGLVGIGTSSPWSTLTVGSGGTANPAADASIHASTVDQYRLKLTSSAFNADTKWLGLGFGYSDNYLKAGILAEAKDNYARTNLHFCLNNSTTSVNASLSDSRMVITYGGNVGIGTSSPQTILDLASGSPTIQFTDTTSVGERNWRIGISDITEGDFNITQETGDDTNTYASRFYINLAGNVGIGTTSPGYKLHCVGDARFESSNVFLDDDSKALVFGTGTTSYIIGSSANNNIRFVTNSFERGRWDSSGRLLVGTSSVSGNAAAKIVVDNQLTLSKSATTILGNSNNQGQAHKLTIVRQCGVVSLGTKLRIPFVSQGNLNSNTICKVWGHGAKYNTRDGLPFEITFGVGHLTVLSNLYSWGGGGNYASIAINGMYVEITFTTAYTSSTADGIFVCLEYMTNQPDYSIDIPNIVMN